MYIMCIQSTLLCEKGTLLKILKLPHNINSALQPIIISSRKHKAEHRDREREKAAFSSNLQSNSCLYPPFPPLHFCLSLSPLSANETSYSSLKLFFSADFTGCKVTCFSCRDGAAWLKATGHLYPNHGHDILHILYIQ